MVKPLIDPETIKKNAYLPVKLSELSKKNPEAALQLLQDWGDGKKTIKKLWDEINLQLEIAPTIAS